MLLTYEQGKHPCVYKLHSSIVHKDINCRYFSLYNYNLIKRVIKARKMKKQFKKRYLQIIDNYQPDIVAAPTNTGKFLSEILSAKVKSHVVIVSHSAFEYDMMKGSPIKKLESIMILHRLKRCDLLIALTDGDASFWKKHVDNVRVVANPVSFYQDKLEVTCSKRHRIICPARLHPQKRLDRLIDAFSLIEKKHPTWYIDIFGEGPLKGQLIDKIRNLGLVNRVNILPPTNNILMEYKKSQLFVLSSDFEGLPLTLLEAMASGVPCVSVSCPFGPSEVIVDGVTGLLAEMNVEDLAKKMDWMMTNEKKRIEMGKKAHQYSARFKEDIVMKQWEFAYKSVS